MPAGHHWASCQPQAVNCYHLLLTAGDTRRTCRERGLPRPESTANPFPDPLLLAPGHPPRAPGSPGLADPLGSPPPHRQHCAGRVWSCRCFPGPSTPPRTPQSSALSPSHVSHAEGTWPCAQPARPSTLTSTWSTQPALGLFRNSQPLAPGSTVSSRSPGLSWLPGFHARF